MPLEVNLFSVEYAEASGGRDPHLTFSPVAFLHYDRYSVRGTGDSDGAATLLLQARSNRRFVRWRRLSVQQEMVEASIVPQYYDARSGNNRFALFVLKSQEKFRVRRRVHKGLARAGLSPWLIGHVQYHTTPRAIVGATKRALDHQRVWRGD